MRRYTVTLTTLLSQSKAVRCEIGRARSLPGKCLLGGMKDAQPEGQRGMEGWREGGVVRNANVTVDGLKAGHWPPLPFFLIQPIIRANRPHLSSLTKLFGLLPHYHEAPSLPLLLLTDPLQISYCTHLTWHALQFFLIPPHY